MMIQGSILYQCPHILPWHQDHTLRITQPPSPEALQIPVTCHDWQVSITLQDPWIAKPSVTDLSLSVRLSLFCTMMCKEGWLRNVEVFLRFQEYEGSPKPDIILTDFFSLRFISSNSSMWSVKYN